MPPSLVLIIRHGEKLGDPTDDISGGPHLSVRGSSRAAALPSLFQTANTPFACTWAPSGQQVTGSYSTIQQPGITPTYPIPQSLIATQPSNNSSRPVETITPLSLALGLTINNNHADKDFAKVANDILTKPDYNGQTVLVCWHHGKIPDLATALGAQNVPPGKWPGNTFDRVWQIPFTNGTAGNVLNSPQSLLHLDSDT